MMKTRSLLQYSITKLEDMFMAGKDDLSLLQSLDNELNYRDTARAQKLLGEVQEELARAGKQGITRKFARPTASAPIIAPKQPDLWCAPTEEPSASPVDGPVVVPASQPSPPKPTPAHLHIPAQGPSKPPSVTVPFQETKTELPSVSAGDAYKILHVSPGSSWEAVEMARRRVVQKAFPELWKPDQVKERDKAQYEARLANEACRVLWAIRLPSAQPSV